ncbi:MAG: hypothetical protein QHH75_13185 [Bacillota bacterium]|jgi:hypothetical protein|nr:hypothetical protein [Bacillota bacterium]
MKRAEFVNRLVEKAGLKPEAAEKALNEILAMRVVPKNLQMFRMAAEEKIMIATGADSRSAALAINEFVGAVTSRPALFKEVIEAFAKNAGIEDSCRSCDGCRNCKNIEFPASQMPVLEASAG